MEVSLNVDNRRAQPMSQTAQSFWADPKVWIAILAVTISVIDLIALSWFRWDQNRRWDALNIARVELSDVYLIAWEELDRNIAVNRNWGYQPMIFSVIKDHVHTDRFRVYEELVLWDPTRNVRIPGSNGFHTLDESQAEIRRVGLGSEPATIFKRMQMQVDLKNAGSTVARDLKITVDLLDDGTGTRQTVFRSTSNVELLSGSSINVNMDIWLPLQSTLPISTQFHLNLSFVSIHGEHLSRMIPIEYQPSRNYWVYGN